MSYKDKIKKQNYEQKYNTLLKYKEQLENDNDALRNKLKTNESDWATNVDSFVERWFEENKEDVDIGVVNFHFFKLDLFPDYIEKYIYKKVLKILYSFLTSAIAPKPTV